MCSTLDYGRRHNVISITGRQTKNTYISKNKQYNSKYAMCFVTGKSLTEAAFMDYIAPYKTVL